MALTASQVKNAKPREKQYKLYDQGGLFLIVRPNGGKWWRFKYRFAKRHREISMGIYPDVMLADARKERDKARADVAKKIDPSAKRQAEKSADEDTFKAVALEWIGQQPWTADSVKRITGRFEKHVFPWLGNRLITEITAPDLKVVIKRVEKRGKVDTARRLLGTCDRIFCYAVADGRAERSPAQDIKGVIKTVKTEHLATITDEKEVGALLRAIDGYKGGFVTSCALKLAPLVFTRPGELRQAEWSEIDLNGAVWRIPGEKMKRGITHLVPLSKQAIEILKDIQPLTGDGQYVFPSVRSSKRAMSENTITGALRRLGYTGKQMTGHGFRSMASTLLHEQQWSSDAIERQLAHAVGGVKGVYNYAQHLDIRTEMMQSWADYLDGLQSGGKVVPIGKRSA